MGHPEGVRETCDVRVGFDTAAYGWKGSTVRRRRSKPLIPLTLVGGGSV